MLPKVQVIMCMQERAASSWLKKWKLYGNTRRVAKSSNCLRVSQAFRAFCGDPPQKTVGRGGRRAANRTKSAEALVQRAGVGGGVEAESGVRRELDDFLRTNNLQSKVRRLLQIIKLIHQGLTDTPRTGFLYKPSAYFSPSGDSRALPLVSSPTGRRLDLDHPGGQADVEDEEGGGLVHEMICEKLTNKLRQQLADPLAITSGAVPDWCHDLVKNYAALFPFDVRWLYFTSCSFGLDRAVAGMQQNAIVVSVNDKVFRTGLTTFACEKNRYSKRSRPFA